MFSYLACYYARNILSAVSPKMVESSQFTLEFIGLMSTINMLTYASGQLLNGALGDFIKAKYMVSGGLILSAVCNFIIPFSSYNMILFSYSLSGFFLQ
ncbi:MAG: MFS transporter [Ruminococcaceae bacterium]|nr:MFS transporter [Oscillospiraceae bacterium]